MATRVSLPGMHTPGAGFDQPFEMLDACHDRVRRSLDLLARLRSYLRDKGCDDSARQAARDVLRYFDMAAPLHHEDEERHVFPPLLAQTGDAPLLALVRQLQRDPSEILITTPESTSVAMSIFSGIFNLGIGSGAFFGGIICYQASIAYIGYAGALLGLTGLAYWLCRLGYRV